MRMGFLNRLRAVGAGIRKAILELPAGFGEAWLKGNEEEVIARAAGGRKIRNPAAEHAYAHGAISSVAQSIVQTPFRLYKRTDKNRDSPIEAGSEFNLFRKPNPMDSIEDIWEKTIIGLLQNDRGVLWILAFSETNPGPSAKPSAILLTNANKFEPVAPKGLLIGWKRLADGQFFPEEQILWFRYPDPEDPWMSLNPFRALARSVAGDVEASVFSNEFFANGARLGLVLSSEDSIVTTDLANELEQKINAKHTGRGRRFRNLVLGGARWKTTDHSINQKDMEFINQRKFTREELRAALRIGPLFLGDVEDGNRANVLGQERVVWRHTLIPIIRRLEKTCEIGYFDRYANGLLGQFDTTGIEALQDDLMRQAEIGEKLLKLNFTPNEINELFEWGFEPKDFRDTVFLPATQLPAEDILSGGLEGVPAPPQEDPSQEFLGNNVIPFRLKARERWRAHFNRFMKHERSVRSKISNHYKGVRKQTLERLRKEFEKGISVTNILWNSNASGTKLLSSITPTLKAALEDGGNQTLSEAGIQGSFDLGSTAASDYLLSRAPLIRNVDSAIRKTVGRSLSKGIAKGENLSQLQARVRKSFNTSTRRARVIAQTEAVGAYNNGKQIAKKKHKLTRIEWLTADDPDVRDSHVGLDGVTRDNDAPFPNGLRWPHDSGGNASEIVNCRCTSEAFPNKE